jgi:tetratricopeptide (TPR) repeat protein
VLPWPAGLLLLPDSLGPDVAAARGTLTAGLEPDEWPALAEPVHRALGDDIDGALAALADWPDTPEVAGAARYNRAVLGGDAADLDALADSDADVAVRGLARTAAYTLGRGGPPDEPADTLPGEVAAVMQSARASALLERGEVGAAVAALERGARAAAAAGSPLLASALHATAAEALRDRSDTPGAALALADAAVDVLSETAPAERRAESLLVRGVCRYHAASAEPVDPGLLRSAVGDLQAALQTFREDRHPDAFAQASQYLALSYLMLPMTGPGDRIRVAVAVSSLRAALRVMGPHTHAEAWASAQLNLANALQYLPSSHAADNLVEAVELYEEVLAVRDRAVDPLGYARLLANQGNALAHLGIHSPAIAKLTEARELFTDAGDAASAGSVDEVLAEIDRVQAG